MKDRCRASWTTPSRASRLLSPLARALSPTASLSSGTPPVLILSRLKLKNISDNFDDKLKIAFKVSAGGAVGEQSPAKQHTESRQPEKEKSEAREVQRQMESLKNKIYGLSAEEFSTDQILVLKQELNEIYDFTSSLQNYRDDEY